VGTGEHDLRLHWLAPDLPFEAADSPFRVVFRSHGHEFSFVIFSSQAGKSAIIRAGASSTPQIAGADMPLLGWESPTYAELRPAVSLLYRTRGPLPIRLVTAVLTDQKCRAEMKADQVTIWRDDLQLFQVGIAPRTKLNWCGFKKAVFLVSSIV
jgi:hypothetical protein